jgi:hypothetical protein
VDGDGLFYFGGSVADRVENIAVIACTAEP